ncbi:hypothetical protein QBA75_25740 [Streptomyces stelliscabiei]
MRSQHAQDAFEQVVVGVREGDLDPVLVGPVAVQRATTASARAEFLVRQVSASAVSSRSATSR